MAATASNDLDDLPVTDGNATFIGGQVSASSEMSVPSDGYVSAVNMDFDAFGRLQTRRGARTTVDNVDNTLWEDSVGNWDADTTVWGTSLSSSPIDASFYFDTYASEYVVLAQSGALLQGAPGTAYVAISGSSYSGSDVYFAQLNNRLYYCDGVGALKYVDSSLGNNAITAGKVSSITITNNGSGYTSVPAITFSSGAAAATAVLAYGGRVVSATVTTPSSGYSATTPPTITFAAAPAGGTTATGRVNISQVPSRPRLLTAHTNRLFCASADTSIPPDTIYVSDILDGESWDLVGASIRVGGDGDPITGLYPWFGNNLLVFKQRSLWVVVADPLVNVADWEIKLINNRVGCVAHRSIQAVGSDVFFLSRDGVRTVSNIESGSQTDVGLPISFSIGDKINAINRTYMSGACSAFYGNRYILAIPCDTATTNSTVIVYNLLTKSWAGVWTGWAPKDFCITAFSGALKLNFSDSTGKFWTWDDYSVAETGSLYRDDSSNYESYVITKAYAYGDPLVLKRGYLVQVFTENRLTDTDAACYLYYDKDLSGSYTSIDTALTVSANDRSARRPYNLLSIGKFNVITFKFGATAGRATLCAISTAAFSDTINPEV